MPQNKLAELQRLLALVRNETSCLDPQVVELLDLLVDGVTELFRFLAPPPGDISDWKV